MSNSFWDPMVCSPPGSSVCGISQDGKWSGWSALSSTSLGDFLQQGTELTSPALVGGFFTTEPLGTSLTYCIHAINTITSWQLTPASLPGESHGQRNLPGYRPKGHKGSDMTEPLHSIPSTLAHSGSLNAGTLLQCVFNIPSAP